MKLYRRMFVIVIKTCFSLITIIIVMHLDIEISRYTDIMGKYLQIPDTDTDRGGGMFSH